MRDVASSTDRHLTLEYSEKSESHSESAVRLDD